MALDYFSGLNFSMAGSSKDYRRTASNKPLYYGVQYNHAGGLWLRVDKKHEYEVEGPCAFVTHPGAYFEYGPLGDGTRHHNYVCFYGPRVQRFIKGGLLNLNPDSHVIRITQSERFLQTISRIINTVFDKMLNQNRAVLTLENLLLQLHEQQFDNTMAKSHQTPYLTALMSEISYHPEREWNFDEAAAHLNVSLVHFRRLFKQYCGLAPQQFVIKQRMGRAAKMLVNTSELVRDIALAVGFDNEFYFSRLFKKTYKLSPRQYRNELAGNDIA